MQRKNTRFRPNKWWLVGAVLLLAAIIAVGIDVAHAPSELARFVQQQHLPSQPLLPQYLPSDAQFLTNSADSHYDTSNQLLVMRWVFPGKSLPGQGTLIVYQLPSTASPSLVPAVSDGTNALIGVITGHIGDVVAASNVPQTPGRRAFSGVFNSQKIVVVSYALSDDDLTKVVRSLQ